METNYLIATHNSVTGEKSRNWLHSLLTPFARCQDLTISEQYKAGCTYFDLRVRFIDGDWRLCHGIWQSSKTLSDILDELTYLSFESARPIVSIFYEGAFGSDYDHLEFLDCMNDYRKEYPQIEFAVLGVKKPEWTNLAVMRDVPCRQDFIGISWQNKTSWLPVPRFWDGYSLPHEFNGKEYTMVDFL